MSNFNPKVSIVIPVYNGSKHLAEAIDSALAQTYKNIEIIVSNDGSNDNGATERVAKSYGNKIIYLGKKENGGAPTALNPAIKIMTGDYFSWLSHDDLYYPNKIQRQIEELAKLKNKNTIMMSDLDGINEKKEKIYQTNYQRHLEDYPPRKKSLIHPVVYNQTHGCTLLIPKACFEEVGIFDPKERVAHDFEYFYRIFQKYPHKLVPEVLVTARDTSNRMGRRAKPQASLEYSRLYIDILEKMTNNEMKLLARDELALLSDMWGFFKAAGYLQAYDYATGRIIKFTEAFCRDLIHDYLEGGIKEFELRESLGRMQEQLSVIWSDNFKAARYVDSNIRQTVGKIDGKSLFTSKDSMTKLTDLLVKDGYIISAAQLFQRTFTLLAKQDDSQALNETVLKNISGDKKFLEEDVDILKANQGDSQKTKIVFCSTHWLTGGMERVMSIIFEQLRDEHEIFLITPSDSREAKIQIPNYVHNIKISNRIFGSNYESAVLSVALVLKIDVLVGVYNLYEKQLNLYGLCHSAGIRTIASNHENFFYPYLNYGLQELGLKRLEAHKEVDAVLWPTNFSAAVSGLNFNNSYLMPNPNTFKVFEGDIIANEKIVICVGRFNDYIKRIDRILKTFKLIQDRVPDSKLYIVGNCDRKKKIELMGNQSIEDLIIELGLDENNLVFTGDVPNVEDYYKRASALILTSMSEGFGMMVNEAACFGVPSVANKMPGLEDLIVDGENGYLVDQDDLESMADKVAKILSDDKLRAELGKNAKQRVTKFDPVEIGKKWKLLIKILKSNHPSEEMRAELSRSLVYKIDSRELSKTLFVELNKITTAELGERKKLSPTPLSTTRSGLLHFIKYSLIRVQRSVRTRGLFKTGELFIKKAYAKLS